jgi:hypothetical protein
MTGREPNIRSAWLVPMLGLASLAISAFFGFYLIDRFVTGGPSGEAPHLVSFFLFDPELIADAIVGLGAMTAAAMAIVVTVVSIVVQLSAERFTGVTAMFFRDRTNVRVLGFYVVTCSSAVWVSLSLKADFVPRATLTLMACAVVLGLALMGPYFAYVFRFLEPGNIVVRIQNEALASARRGASGRGSDCASAQAAALSSMEEIADITSNSIGGKDKIIASRAIDALKDLAVNYVPLKAVARPEWFCIGPQIKGNPDFVAMDGESLTDLEDRRTWFEWKVMRQYLGIYNEALGPMRDINYLIAIDTRYILEAAAEASDQELIELCFRYMNSYLRATLNAKDVRTAYNVLNQYRLAIEALLRRGDGRTTVAATRYLRYYAHVSYDMKLSFVTETIAYDVASVCQLAHELEERDVEKELLEILLDIDRPTEERAQEQGLRGVRKAQAKLASYYLYVGAEEEARLIHHDMATEPATRLRGIRDELLRVESKDFWEIIDRGRNFEYVPEPQRRALEQFFRWFELARTPEGGDDPPREPSTPEAALTRA